MTARIRDIYEPLNAFSPETTVSAALQYFRSMPGLAAIPVVFDAVPLGILSRTVIAEACLNFDISTQILQQPVTGFMSTDIWLAEASEPAALVAKRFTDQGLEGFKTGMIVIESGHYAGFVTPESLFAAVTKENEARARVMKKRAAAYGALQSKLDDTREEHVQFVSFLAHEIRTPLTGVLGVADLLSDRKLDSQSKDYARTISQSGQHLDHLLSDILDLSRLEVGKLDIAPAPFKLSEFAHETRSLWSGRAHKKNISLKVNFDDGDIGRIEADATRLRQILFNLIGNAMKFTETGTVSVNLSVSAKGYHGAILEMRVADTGVGIADADKQRLFEAFEQAGPQTAHQYGGTGLGLSIAKGLIEQMEGSVSLTDNPEGGAIFTVTCPVLKAGPRLAVENTTKRRKANFQLGRILLVEDHDVSQIVISEALRAVGWTVDIVETAEQGARRGQQIPYQAILLDLHLGTQSGLDIAKTLREQAGPNTNSPILAVSADVSAKQSQRCAAAGFSGFIAKPIRPRTLVATLVDSIIAYNAHQDIVETARETSSQQVG